MDHRNLRRYFCYNKAVRLWQKNEGLSLRRGEVNVLIALSGLDPITLTSLGEYLTSFNRGIALDYLTTYLRSLSSQGFVRIEGRYPAKYSLTFSGVNLLSSLETKVRETRYDK